MRPAARAPRAEFWSGRRVLLTGHTGFKGAWLAMWLSELGAEVHGFALEPPTTPNLFDDAQVATCLASDTRADICAAGELAAALSRARPEIVLHLAAQSLVRLSHVEPIATLTTNVMGTATLLDAACRAGGVAAVIVVTSDKCYENREWVHPYRETDALGGLDPYSASKGCAEIVTASWRASFASKPGSPRIASARAGNVIGAGDWARDRLVPDCIRAFAEGRSVKLRNPGSVRPWQHVLEPLSGYLILAEELCASGGERHACGWNFGPDLSGDASVGDVAEAVARIWGGGARVETEAEASPLHEAGILRLDSTASRVRLGWTPRWDLQHALAQAVAGYRSTMTQASLRKLLIAQIADHASTPAAVTPG